MRTALLLAAIIGLEVVGNTCLSHGMRQMGPLVWGRPTLAGLLSVAGRLGANPWVIGGVAALLGYFLCYLMALARLDLSYVLPMVASSYLLTTGLAWGVLGERVSLVRWAGTGLIGAGLFLVQASTRRPPGPS